MQKFLPVLILILGSSSCAQESETQDSSAFNQVATSTSPAIITLERAGPDFDPQQSSLEVRIRAAEISEDEPFMVVVYEEVDSKLEELDSFSFFQPAKLGEVQDFLIAAPAGLASQETVLHFQLVSISDSEELAATKVEFLDANLRTP